MELLPALEPRDPTSAYLFYDCQTDDSRLVLTILGEAERFGAACVNDSPVVELIEEQGKAAGVVCVRPASRASASRSPPTTSSTRPASGPTASGPRSFTQEEDVPVIRPSRGTHIVIDREKLPLNAAAIVPAGQGRTIFALPWLGQTLIGTTDNDYEGGSSTRSRRGGRPYLLKAVNALLRSRARLRRRRRRLCGVRPLISTGDPKKSVDISRRAELYETSSGMITITGGKLTTWRRMAKSVVDRLAEREFRDAPCRTHEILLGHEVDPAELPQIEGVDERSREHLASRYGLFAEQALRICAERPELAKPILPGFPDLLVEATVAARHEQARGVADVLLRRTRLGLLAARRLADDRDALRRVAAAMAPELGWDRRRIKREADAWIEAAAAEGLVPMESQRPLEATAG